MKLNDSVVTDGMDKAEALNSYFQSVFTNELDTELPNKGPSPYQVCQILMLLYRVLLNYVLNGLNVHKVSGPDLISTRFLKKQQML